MASSSNKNKPTVHHQQQQRPTSTFEAADRMIRKIKLENTRHDLKRSAKKLGMVKNNNVSPTPQTTTVSSATKSNNNKNFL
jgi:hypothetical protein